MRVGLRIGVSMMMIDSSRTGEVEYSDEVECSLDITKKPTPKR